MIIKTQSCGKQRRAGQINQSAALIGAPQRGRKFQNLNLSPYNQGEAGQTAGFPANRYRTNSCNAPVVLRVSKQEFTECANYLSSLL